MPRRGAISADPGLAVARKTSPALKAMLKAGHDHGGSVREDTYKGHRIIIRTHYEIEIDGKPFAGSLDVAQGGTVQYHGIPNVSAVSAVDLMRAVIDAFPNDFAAGQPVPHGEHDHGEHGHGQPEHGGGAHADHRHARTHSHGAPLSEPAPRRVGRRVKTPATSAAATSKGRTSAGATRKGTRHAGPQKRRR
jgi:hypothetical protein